VFLALTPNPALDRTLTLAGGLEPHRLKRVREAAGGKGVNVARVLRALGAEVVVAGFLAGWNGRKFRALLAQEGLTGHFAEVAGETRECHILLGPGRHPTEASHPTEVNEPGPHVSGRDWSRLLGKLPPGTPVISGSLAPGLRPEEFADILTSFMPRPVVDTSGAALRAALEVGVALVKPNLAELGAITRTPNPSVRDARALFETYGTPILLTLGAAGAAYIGEERCAARPPPVAAANPVGSGDSLLAAFLWARHEGRSLEAALRFGVAAGADNARQGGARVTKEGVLELASQVTTEAIT
jgi:tagatose 6-phosphate kinase